MPFSFNTQSFRSKKINFIGIGAFFFALLILGMNIYKDYGISWDERVERIDGAVSLRYINQYFGVTSPGLERMLAKQNYPASIELDSYKDRYYPTGFNLPIEAAIQWLQLEDEQQAYYFRHLFTFLIVLLGAFAIFSLANRRYNDWRIGLLAVTFFILSPRFFAESFYNSKDLVLLAFFAFAMNTLIVFVLRPQISTALLHSLATALAMNIRLMAIVIPMMTIAILLVRILRREVAWPKVVATTLIYLAGLACLMTVAWPLLWADPMGRFLDALSFMRHYLFVQDNFYLGQVISSIHLPWHFLPVWIGITTPIPYLVLFLFGTLVILHNVYQSKLRLWKDANQLQDLIFLGLFFAPILGVIILHSVIYDSWRHLYFIYPAFLMLTMRGMVAIWEKLYHHAVLKKCFILTLCLSLLYIASWMIRAHPLQNVYFNLLAGNNLKARFDLDYWGLSNRQALEYILAHDTRDKIVIKVGSFTFLPLSLSIMSPADRQRIAFSEDLNEADYIISNYRLNQTDYANFDPRYMAYHDIRVGNEIILSIAQAKRNTLTKAVQLNQLIEFSNTGIGQYFLQSDGWAQPESWGVWAIKPEAKFLLPMPSSNPKYLSFNLRAFVSAKNPSQKLEIIVNGQIQKTLLLKKASDNLVQLEVADLLRYSKEADITSPKKLEIIFRSTPTFSPKSIGLGNDDRLLSVGLVSAIFN